MKSNDRTNGMLEVLESNLIQCETVLQTIINQEELCDKAFEILRKAKINLINVERDVGNALAWNLDDSN